MKTRFLFLSICLALEALSATSCVQPEVEVYGSISGLIKNAHSGELISGVRVTLSPGGTSQITSSDGSFTFEDLDSGDYTLSFTKDGFEDESAKVSVKTGVVQNVQISMIPIQPKLSVSANVLNFAVDGTSLSLDITNSGKGMLNWEVSENIGWIECSPMSGSVTSSITPLVITADRSSLDQGNYSGSFVISSNGGSETIIVSISVNGLTLEAEPAELDFGTVMGSLQLTLTNTSSGSIQYNATPSNSWLVLSKQSGTISKKDYITAVVSREGLSPGKYDGSITISTDKGAIAVPVKMEVAKNEKPAVAAESFSDVTYFSAVLRGTVLSVGSDKITRYGFCWSEKENPTLDDNYTNLGDCSSAKSFECMVTGLESETKYYFRAYAENNVGLSYSDKVLSCTTYALPTVPGVSTGTIESITQTSARAKGNITSLGNLDVITSYGHVWSVKPAPTIETASHTDLGKITAASSFTSKIEGLTCFTTYYVRAYATNAKGTAYGEDVAIITEKGDPQVETGEVTEIIHDSALCSGKVVTTGGHQITERGVCYGKTAIPTYNGTHQASDDEDSDTFTVHLTGLEHQTVYYVRAYVKTSGNLVFYGSDVKFATTKKVTLPALSDVSITQITTTGAAFTSKITSDGNSTVTECGFCWSRYNNPDVADNVLKCETGSTDLGKSLSGLAPGTEYHVRAYAKNAMGTAYSEDAVFSTLPLTLPKVTVAGISNVGRTKAKASASIVSDGNAEITHIGFCYSEQQWPTRDDNVVYGELSGSSFSAAITGLKEKTIYYVRPFAANSVGTGYGEMVSFTTTDEDFDEWDGTVATAFGGGSGTSSDPILINNAAQLAFLAKKVNSGSTFSGVYFKLTSALSLSGKQWTAIGQNSSQFMGIFDGDGHRIEEFYGSIGLFFNNEGTIRNVIISGKLNAGSSSTRGAIAGTNTGSIINCHSFVSVESTGDKIGGICGSSSTGTISKCTNSGEVKGKNNVGGITGTGSASRCVNEGAVRGSSQVGGISGCISTTASDVVAFQDCQNSSLVAGSSRVGGIVGFVEVTNRDTYYSYDSVNMKTCSILNCSNCGSFDKGTATGGICGECSLVRIDNHYNSSYKHGAGLTISNCSNYSSFGLLGKLSDNRADDQYYNYNRLSYSGSYWLYDIVNDLGQENARCDLMTAGDYYSRTGSACYLNGNTSKDIVSILNKWVSDNSGHLSWQYGKSNDGYARPELIYEQN